MLHRLSSVLVRPGRERLAGIVEVDETYIGGRVPGLRGGRAKGKQVLTGSAVEIHEPIGYGRCRMAPLADASSPSLHAFVTDHVEPGATGITDGWRGTGGWSGSATATYRAVNARPGLAERTPANCCPPHLVGQAMASGNPPGLGR